MANAEEHLPQLPEEECDNCGDSVATNMNEAEVSNRIEVRSGTGKNWAGGSYGGDGGDGGDVRNGGYGPMGVKSADNGDNSYEDCGGDVEDSATGSGGNGGAASTGGTVMSGNASAFANISNTANVNRTLMDRCACVEEEECDCGRDAALNFNEAGLENEGEIKAYTGENDTDGSYGGSGGQAGDIDNTGSGDVEGSNTGDAGHGNDGGEGGMVQSGSSNSRIDIVNVLNRNITRVLR